MESRKPYFVVFLVNAIYAGMYLLTKAAFNVGMNTYIFVFYRQAFATIFLVPVAIFVERKTAMAPSCMILFKIFMLALVGITFSLNMYNVGLNYTTATVASAISNLIPVMTFTLAVLLGVETLKMRTRAGLAKFSGVSLCLGGALIIAFYTGPSLNLHLFHLHAFGASARTSHGDTHQLASKIDWVKGTFLLIISNFTWSLWMVFQGKVLALYPSKLLVTTFQCLFSTIQSFCVAVAIERDFSKWKLNFDVGLLAVLYCGLVVTGISFYLQAWCIEKKGPVFLAISLPLTLVITMSISTLLGDDLIVGSVLGGVLLIGGLYSVMWGKTREQKDQAKLPVAQNEKESMEEMTGMASPFHPI